MQVFISQKLRHQLTSLRTCKAAFGVPMAKKIFLRLDQARSANTLADLRHAPGKWHELKYDRKHQIGVHLVEPDRIIFNIENDPGTYTQENGGVDWNKIDSLSVAEIKINYHKEK